MNDNGEVTGIDDYKKLLEEFPNKAVNHLGLMVDENGQQDGHEILPRQKLRNNMKIYFKSSKLSL
ncbi:MAG TPA: hypothetical protein VHD83_24545 [Puia sp.]|nr:hypothetical protein [Puia sp.]